jgi:hypothetical protein
MSKQLDELKRLVMLENHLTSNFFPPKSPALAPLCIAALDQYSTGEGDEIMPGVTLNDCRVTPNQVIEMYCLEQLLEEICL